MRNRPLTHEQVKKLPVRQSILVKNEKGFLQEQVMFSGFTPTGMFPNNRERRAPLQRRRPNPWGYNNRKSNKARYIQMIPESIEVETSFGPVRKYTGKFRKVQHSPMTRVINK